MIPAPEDRGRWDLCDFKANQSYTVRPCFKEKGVGTAEMALLLREVAILPEDPRTIPSIRMVAHNC